MELIGTDTMLACVDESGRAWTQTWGETDQAKIGLMQRLRLALTGHTEATNRRHTRIQMTVVEA